jgi:hypothetical protein
MRSSRTPTPPTLYWEIKVVIAQKRSLPHRIDVCIANLGLRNALRASKQVFFEPAELDFIGDFAQIVSFEVVLGDVLPLHRPPKY